eukprot:gene2688-5291_t
MSQELIEPTNSDITLSTIQKPLPENSDRKYKPKNVKFIWSSGSLLYLTKNIWSSSVTEEVKESCRRLRPLGVDVRDLPSGHPLYGEKGLFATKKFSEYDMVGEYTGRIISDNVEGHYVALLEDKPPNYNALGVDAGQCGNEMRFINSYSNVSDEPNLTMRTVYIDTYPHLVLVCTKNIEVDDEFLLDYGEAYNQAYLTPKPPVVPYTNDEMRDVLPLMLDSDDEEEEDSTSCSKMNLLSVTNGNSSLLNNELPLNISTNTDDNNKNHFKNLKYTQINWWSPNISKERKEASRRMKPFGVDVRNLPPTHFLHGERGLFATVKYSKYDVIGEYTGRVVDQSIGDKPTKESMGVDAAECGNEMRFINSYFNVATESNLSFQSVYINTYPHLVLVCTKNIEVDDEFLLDYGEAYNQAYLTPKPPVVPYTNDEMRDILPLMLDSDDETDG